MICQTCQGQRFILQAPAPDQKPIMIPCPDCGGCGIGHCCDGLSEQEEDRTPRIERDSGNEADPSSEVPSKMRKKWGEPGA